MKKTNIVLKIITIIISIVILMQSFVLFYAIIQSFSNQNFSGGIDVYNTYLLPFGYITLIINISFLCTVFYKPLRNKFLNYAIIFIILYLILLCFVPVVHIAHYTSPSSMGVTPDGRLYTRNHDFENFTIYKYTIISGIGVLFK